MKINQFEIWIANLNPQRGTEPGKVRPVLVIQSNILNNIQHPSTLVCPISTNLMEESQVLRVKLVKESTNLKKDSTVLLDQIRAVDNKKFIERLGHLSEELEATVKKNIIHILDLE